MSFIQKTFSLSVPVAEEPWLLAIAGSAVAVALAALIVGVAAAYLPTPIDAADPASMLNSL